MYIGKIAAGGNGEVTIERDVRSELANEKLMHNLVTAAVEAAATSSRRRNESKLFNYYLPHNTSRRVLTFGTYDYVCFICKSAISLLADSVANKNIQNNKRRKPKRIRIFGLNFCFRIPSA